MQNSTVTQELENELKACIIRSRCYWNSQQYGLSNRELARARRIEQRLDLAIETGDYK
jgi:hypothetical protein